MKLVIILFCSVFAVAQQRQLSTPIPIATEPAYVECGKLGQAQCGGTCKSVYGGEGECTWASLLRGECYCAPIVEASLSCSCPGSCIQSFTDPKTGMTTYRFHNCKCGKGTCVEKKVNVEPIKEPVSTESY